jgi:hypothetical protein
MTSPISPISPTAATLALRKEPPSNGGTPCRTNPASRALSPMLPCGSSYPRVSAGLGGSCWHGSRAVARDSSTRGTTWTPRWAADPPRLPLVAPLGVPRILVLGPTSVGPCEVAKNPCRVWPARCQAARRLGWYVRPQSPPGQVHDLIVSNYNKDWGIPVVVWPDSKDASTYSAQPVIDQLWRQFRVTLAQARKVLVSDIR